MYFRVCPHCGCSLDPSESCDCQQERRNEEEEKAAERRNLCQPEKEAATEAKREYSESKPPRAPKGYRLVEAKTNRYGYMCFKYVRSEDAAEAPPPNNRKRPLKC